MTASVNSCFTIASIKLQRRLSSPEISPEGFKNPTDGKFSNQLLVTNYRKIYGVIMFLLFLHLKVVNIFLHSSPQKNTLVMTRAASAFSKSSHAFRKRHVKIIFILKTLR
jgi:hypothetical protein